ncbi:MAG: GNAT family N-acetyltransferase [Legionella sp.]|jgi:hypothetical protein
MEYEVITDLESFNKNINDYRTFISHFDDAHYEYRPEYILGLFESDTDYQPIIIVLKYANKIILVAPFVKIKQLQELKFGLYTIFKYHINEVRLLGSHFIHEPTENIYALYKKVFDILHDNKFTHDILKFYIDSTSSIIHYLKRNHLAIGALKCKITDSHPHYRLLLKKDYNDFFLNLPRHTRRLFLKSERLLTDNHILELKLITEEKDVPLFHQQITEILTHSWKKNYFSPPQLDQITFMAKLDYLRSYLLYINNEPIAFLYAIQPNEKELLFIETGYKAEWKNYSPGRVLYFNIIKNLYSYKKPEICDLGEGANDLKLDIANNMLTTLVIICYKKRTLLSLLIAVQSTLQKIYIFNSKLIKATKLDKYIRKLIK